MSDKLKDLLSEAKQGLEELKGKSETIDALQDKVDELEKKGDSGLSSDDMEGLASAVVEMQKAVKHQKEELEKQAADQEKAIQDAVKAALEEAKHKAGEVTKDSEASNAVFKWADGAPKDKDMPPEMAKYSSSVIRHIEVNYKSSDFAKALRAAIAKGELTPAYQKTAGIASAPPFDGAGTSQVDIYAAQVEGNGFLPYITDMPVTNSQFTLPRLDTVDVVAEAAVARQHQASNADNIPDDTTVNCPNFVGEYTMSQFAQAQFNAIAGLITSQALPQAMGAHEAATIVAAIEGAPTGRRQATGQAAGLGANDAAVVRSFTRLPAHINNDNYLTGARYFVSSSAFLELFVAVSGRGGFMRDPATGLPALGGYPVHQISHMAAVAANAIPVAFCQASRAIIKGTFMPMRMRQYTDTHPRATLFDVAQAYGVSLWDANALAVLRVQA